MVSFGKWKYQSYDLEYTFQIQWKGYQSINTKDEQIRCISQTRQRCSSLST